MRTPTITYTQSPDYSAPVPQSVADDLRALRSTDQGAARAYICLLRSVGGWTLRAIADAAGVTRERVRQMEMTCARDGHITHDLLCEDGAIRYLLPRVPLKDVEVRRFIPKRLPPEAVKELRVMRDAAFGVRGKMRVDDPRREAAWRFVSKVAQYRDEGYPIYGMAKDLGVTIAALQMRLTRYGFRETTGQSKCYRPVMKSPPSGA